MLPVSIIIPTHNRGSQVEALLKGLSQQDFDLQDMEVVVVADSCTDDTAARLGHIELPYAFRFVSKDFKCAAAARNCGASMATGRIFIFIDDDVEPSTSLVKAHVSSHSDENSVVIGYLKYELPEKADFYRIKLWAWWEDKFLAMGTPGYWHNFEDLLSGNFSISSRVFKDLNGFNATLKCREDYEFGARLIKAGVNFHYNSQAWGYHRDFATDLERSLARKKNEGTADVQFVTMHPDFIRRFRLRKYNGGKLKIKKSLFYYFVCHMPALTDVLANMWRRWMKVQEALKMRHKWQRGSYRLHDYWYLRGVLSHFGSRTKFIEFLKELPKVKREVLKLEIDLAEGVDESLKRVDNERPDAVDISYNGHKVGTLGPWTGGERLRGSQVRAFLATNLSWHLVEAMSMDNLTSRHKKPELVEV